MTPEQRLAAKWKRRVSAVLKRARETGRLNPSSPHALSESMMRALDEAFSGEDEWRDQIREGIREGVIMGEAEVSGTRKH